MTQKLLLSGVILLPFYEFIVYALLPSGKLPEWIDFRQTKEYCAIGLALLLATVIWQEVKSISCHNKWMLFFLVFMFFNYAKTPIAVANPIVDLSLIGKYSAEFKVFAFFLMFCSLASVKVNIEKVMKTMMVCSVVMAGYMILQACNLDQIFKPKPEYFGTGVKVLRVAGFFGQPTLAVPFVVMGIPLAVYFKQWWGVGILTIAALLTGSAFGIGSLILILGVYAGIRKHKGLALITGVLILLCIGLYFIKPSGLFNDNSRYQVWRQILTDVFSGTIHGVPVRIGLFGAGLNNFGEIFTALHESAYTYAHNEYLQILWTCGVTGLFLFLAIHYDVFRVAWHLRKDSRVETLGISLLAICFCACGTFVFQLGVYQFYTVVLVGLIYQITYQRTQNDSQSTHSAVQDSSTRRQENCNLRR